MDIARTLRDTKRVLFLVFIAILSFLASAYSQRRDAPECLPKIDISQGGSECYLQKGWLHRHDVIWVNGKSDKVRYVCFQTHDSPFEAYSWEVPAKGPVSHQNERKSHDFRKDAKVKEYSYDVLEVPCEASTAERKDKTQPKIIIKGSR